MTRTRRRPWAEPAVVGTMLVLVFTAAAARTTDVHAPPRYDGAGYAVLAESLAAGRGYREIDQPDAPRHAHFPPGYPLALALLWKATGVSVEAAHRFSLACTTLAVLLAWRWFRSLYGPRVAAILGFALALNWTWDRTAGSIQSEPLFLLLGLLALWLMGRRHLGVEGGAALGAVLAACVLTRQVGVALAGAVVVELVLRKRYPAALTAAAVVAALLAPWVVWLATVREHTQAALLVRDSLFGRVGTLGVFYVRRTPDLITGPFVEIATVFRRAGSVSAAAKLWAVGVTSLIVLGWVRTLANPRRRLVGLVAGLTLALLLVWPFTEAGRFLIPLLPCVLVAAVEGLAAVGARLVGRRRARRVAALLVLALALPYSVYALATDRASAQRLTSRDLDAACDWLAHEAPTPGPVLTRHPGEVYWQTRRHAVAPRSDDPESLAGLIDRFGVAYLLVDDERYANAPPSALGAFVHRHPERVREVWKRESGRSAVTVYAVDAATRALGISPENRPDDTARTRPSPR